jgi:hypothetical protein
MQMCNSRKIYLEISEEKRNCRMSTVFTSVAELHHFYAALAPGENFDAAPAPVAPAPTLLYSKAKFLN